MRTNSRMSLGHTLRATCGTLPSNENELLTRHLAMRTNSLLTRQLSNENELLTHTLASKVRYFHVTPLQRRRLSSQQPQAALKLGNQMGLISVFVLSVATGFLWQLLTTLTWVVTFFLLGCLHTSRALKRKLPPKNANFVRKPAESCYFTEIPLVYAQKVLSSVVIRW